MSSRQISESMVRGWEGYSARRNLYKYYYTPNIDAHGPAPGRRRGRGRRTEGEGGGAEIHDPGASKKRPRILPRFMLRAFKRF